MWGGQWFSTGTPVSSTNKTDHHNRTEILLKVALNTINHFPQLYILKEERVVLDIKLSFKQIIS
jgi:hypothetical protein